MFPVTTLDFDRWCAMKTAMWFNRLFGREAKLTVSSQLNETYAMAFRNVYTFGPTFGRKLEYAPACRGILDG